MVSKIDPSPTAHRLAAYTIPEVALRLRVSEETARRLARKGALPVPVLRIGSRMIVSAEALDRFLASGTK